MPVATNSLVGSAKKLVLPMAGSFALGALLFANHPGVHAAAVSAGPLDDHSVAALTSLDQAMESLAARVTPSVVNIAVTSRSTERAVAGSDDDDQMPGLPPGLPPGFAQFFGHGNHPVGPQTEHGIGSGVIISPDGYIVTNGHVIEGASQIKVTLHDRRVLNAKLIGVDKLTDLAVVKVDASELPSISWGDSAKLEPGQTVLAFGSPFGYFQFSVTRGIVSAVNRPNPYAEDARKPGGFIQTDAAMNPGNSGGPLVNAHGELVGINTFIISSNGSFAGAGFAIPSQIAHATAEQLIKHGKVEHAYLGIGLNDVTPENAQFFHLPDASGAIVSQVTPDSPASGAGLRTGDVIYQMNGEKVVNGSALQVAVAELTPGTRIALGVLREGKPTTVQVTLGQFHDSAELASNAGQEGPRSGKLGLAVRDLTPETRRELEAPASVQGVAVESVRPGSPAEDAGIAAGDIIVEVNRQPASSAEKFVSQVRSRAGKEMLLLVWSKGNASYRTLHPAQQDQNG